MTDWSAMWPWIAFIPFFVWLMFFQARRNTPLTAAERRRALVIGSLGSLVGIVLGVVCLVHLMTPGTPVPAAPPQAPPPPAAVPADPPPAQAPALR